MKDQRPYRDIRHTLCGVNSNARWDRSKYTGRHATLQYAHLNQETWVCLKIVCSVFPSKHTSDVTWDRVVLVYRLMKGMQVNSGSVLRHNMMKFRNNKRWRFCYGSLLTHYMRLQGVEEEVHYLCPRRAPYFVCNMVDVTKTKAQDTSYGLVLTSDDRQACDDCWMR